MQMRSQHMHSLMEAARRRISEWSGPMTNPVTETPLDQNNSINVPLQQKSKTPVKNPQTNAVGTTTSSPIPAPAIVTPCTTSSFNIEKAVEHLNKYAAADYKTSQRECSKYVADVIIEGGIVIERAHAQDLGRSLRIAKFEEISAKHYTPQKGDVVVFQVPPSKEYGHVQMYNGTQWVSDHKQRTAGHPKSFFPRPQYESVAYKIYRYPTSTPGCE